MRSLMLKRNLRTRITASAANGYLPRTNHKDTPFARGIQDTTQSQERLEHSLNELTLGAPLGTAIAFGDASAVRDLLSKGADPNGWSYVDSISHLAHAAKLGNQEILQILLDHGALPKQSGALWDAAQTGNIAAAKVLIERGVDVDEVILSRTQARKKNEQGLFDRDWKIRRFGQRTHHGTPLLAAVSERLPEMVKFLLSKGADIYLTDSRGSSPVSASWYFGAFRPNAGKPNDLVDHRREVRRIIHERDVLEKRRS